MKKHSILICLLCLLTVALSLPAAAMTEVTVRVRVEGAEETLYSGTVTCSQDGKVSVYDVLVALDKTDNGIDIQGLEYGYITAIGDQKAGCTAQGWDGFGIRVSGNYISYDRLKSTYVYGGESLVIYYADEFGTGLLVPMVDTSEIHKGKLVFYAESEENGATTVVPIKGATVRWYCDEEFAQYVTDEFGCVTVHESFLTSGEHRISIHKQNEEGIPAVLRMDPSYSVRVTTMVGDSPAIYITAVLTVVSALGLIVLLLTGKRRHNGV